MEYIHYGCSKFDKKKFKKVKNRPEYSQPYGGFWASRVDTNNGWKNWCERENYETNLNEYFTFKLNEQSKVLTINNCEQLRDLPKREGSTSILKADLDFEKLSKEYDAIEVVISEDSNLYFQLYGWDCDSILIMNPDIIEVGKKIGKEFLDIDLEADM